MTRSPSPETMPIPPDGYVILAIAGAVLFEFVLPLSLLPPAAWWGPLTFVGLAMGAAGLTLEITAARALSRGGTATRPNEAPAALVTGGVFRRSRNPFYCGILLLVAGIMVGFSLDWGVIVLPFLWLALDRLVIPVEERRLERAFAQVYLDYTAKTRRWL